MPYSGYTYGNKLGEYIHYKYENYMRYGLARKADRNASWEKGARTLETFLKEAKDEAKRSVTDTNLAIQKAWEAQIQWLMGNPNTPSNITNSDLESVREIVLKHLQETYKNITAEDLDWETITLRPSARNKLASKIDYQAVASKLGKNKALALSTITTKFGQGNYMSISAFNRRVAMITELIATIQDAKTQEKLTNTLSDITTRIKELGIVRKGTAYIGGESLAKELVRLGKEVVKGNTIALFNGDFLEVVSHVAGEQLKNTAQYGMSEIMSSLEGRVLGSNIFLSSQFMKGIKAKQVLPNATQTKISKDKIIWTVNSQVQGKVDVSLTVDDNILKASAKNYNLNSKNPRLAEVHLVTGTNLLYLFANKAKFLNHYLNQTVDSITPSEKQTVIPRANEIMKDMIILSAFTGGGLRMENGKITSGNKASVFLINDNSTKFGIRVVPIAKIYNEIISDSQLRSKAKVSLSRNHQWHNPWANPEGYSGRGATARITSLLAEVKSYKISASIGFDAMKTALNRI